MIMSGEIRATTSSRLFLLRLRGRCWAGSSLREGDPLEVEVAGEGGGNCRMGEVERGIRSVSWCGSDLHARSSSCIISKRSRNSAIILSSQGCKPDDDKMKEEERMKVVRSTELCGAELSVGLMLISS